MKFYLFFFLLPSRLFYGLAKKSEMTVAKFSNCGLNFGQVLCRKDLMNYCWCISLTAIRVIFTLGGFLFMLSKIISWKNIFIWIQTYYIVWNIKFELVSWKSHSVFLIGMKIFSKFIKMPDALVHKRKWNQSPPYIPDVPVWNEIFFLWK